MSWFFRIMRQITHLRLRPIRVFCLHHVSDVYDPFFCFESDWVSTASFKQSIIQLLKSYSIIPLVDAHKRIARDFFRFRKYAVLTFDDGYRSPLEVYQWLEDHHIPFTLFLNAKYLDGQSISPHIIERVKSQNSYASKEVVKNDLYLSYEDLAELFDAGVCFGSHGYEHLDATCLSYVQFKRQLCNNIDCLKQFAQFIPYHAYTWGRHSNETDQLLKEMEITPVLMDGQKNYNDATVIHRELFPIK